MRNYIVYFMVNNDCRCKWDGMAYDEISALALAKHHFAINFNWSLEGPGFYIKIKNAED